MYKLGHRRVCSMIRHSDVEKREENEEEEEEKVVARARGRELRFTGR